jgi:hypothetical protein
MLGMLRTSNTRFRAAIRALAWLLIAGLSVATLLWTIWAGHQPRPHSSWGEPSDKPLD